MRSAFFDLILFAQYLLWCQSVSNSSKCREFQQKKKSREQKSIQAHFKTSKSFTYFKMHLETISVYRNFRLATESYFVNGVDKISIFFTLKSHSIFLLLS